MLFLGYVLVFEILIGVAAYVSVTRLSEDLPDLEDLERATYNQALSAIGSPPTEFGSALGAFEAAYEHERKVTG